MNCMLLDPARTGRLDGPLCLVSRQRVLVNVLQKVSFEFLRLVAIGFTGALLAPDAVFVLVPECETIIAAIEPISFHFFSFAARYAFCLHAALQKRASVL